MTRESVAVVGSGVAGLTAAWIISKSADVTLYEADERPGGHADTHDVVVDGQVHPVDTGFIVHNRRTYPVLLRLFDELGVKTRPSEMSLSVRDDVTGIEWAGALGLRGLIPTPRLLLHPRHLWMLAEIPRFHRRARRLVQGRGRRRADTSQTTAEFLLAGRFSDHFRRHFMEPLIAAVWSCDPETALDYPAAYLFQFLDHHGMLGVFGSPRWRTVEGGSRTYVERVVDQLHQVRHGTKVTQVTADGKGILLTDGNGGTARYDAVVLATHPDQALDMLGVPTDEQRDVLAAIPYATNHAVLHTDTSVLPSLRPARAAWNFHRSGESTGLTVTYDLSRLQGLATERPLLLTLGGTGLVDESKVLERMEYAHPQYSPTSVAAQRRLHAIGSDRLAFAGAYHGWGFHEDGARSGLTAAGRIGYAWGPEVGVYKTTIRHTRREPFRRTFSHESHLWLVDVDDLPDHGRRSFTRGRVEARDHLGDPALSIRANVEAFLADAGRPFRAGRILLTTQPRAWGYCFNPISVFWCHDDADRLVATIVEVHNTYGDRHAYLVDADEAGRGHVDKQMYVSPFHGVDGVYTVVAPVPNGRINVAISLRTAAGAVFSASLDGAPVRESREIRRATWSALRGAALIHAHGVWLWLRRLPVQPRPPHHQRGVSS
jgi:predicted NAD/FAD-binding protein/DUF1365 family protein